MALLKTIKDIDRHARDNPANAAICGKIRIVTYESLRDAIVNVSAQFASRKVTRGAKVYINSADEDLWTVAVLACLHYGLVPFCIWHPDINAGEVDYDLIVSSPEMIDENLPGDIVIDDGVFDPASVSITANARTDWQEEDLIAVGVTSGTTGRPKLLTWNYQQFMRRIPARAVEERGFRLIDTFGITSSTGFTMLSAYFGGGRNLVRGDKDPSTTLRLINLFCVDKLKTSPSSINALMETMDLTGMKCPTVSSIHMVGSAIPALLLEKIERYFSARIFSGYGISEIGTVSLGRISSDTFRTGMTGPLVSPLEFITRPHETSGKDQFFVRNDPTYILGTYQGGKAVLPKGDLYPLPDFGRIEDGILYVEGRIDEVYNLSGTKYAFSTLIDFLTDLDEIDDAAVIRDPDNKDPFGLNVAIVRNSPSAQDDVMEKLCKRLNRRSARNHIRLKTVHQIPRNRAGKIDRTALLSLFTG